MRRSRPTCRRAWPPLRGAGRRCGGAGPRRYRPRPGRSLRDGGVGSRRAGHALLSRAVEADILPTLRELGIGLTAYGVLGRGLISGHWSAGHVGGPGDLRGFSPRFSSGNVEHNLALVEALRRVADAKGYTVAQLAIAWVAAQGEYIVPLVSARTRERLVEALPATELDLTANDLAEIEKAVPEGAARGDRYPPAFMSSLGVGN
ncbi:aldo/keto reductase [Pseudonocardia sp. CA-142604]|uniref:aldo/keto reductase n=1 Tax=Pseudonocardia sp. CA-142604 TaxID=3240024 RepID=UPI003D9284AA